MFRLKIRLLLAIQISLFLLPLLSFAATVTPMTLPWSSSFGSTAKTFSYDGNDTNIVDNLAAIENHPLAGYLSATANNPGGTGAMGYQCMIADGLNGNTSPGLGALFATPQKELWFRFYVKYPAGFRWSELGWHKWIYLGDAASYNSLVFEPVGDDQLRIISMNSNVSYYGTGGWKTFWAGGGTASNGSWHCVEIHVKMDTNNANGIAEYWVDGVKYLSNTTANFSAGSAAARQGWTMWRFNTNQSNPSNAGGIGSPSYVAYDDVAISNTGYIGPLSGGGISTPSDTSPPVISNANPTGTLAYGTTSTSLSVTTDENATCKYNTTDVAYASMANTFATTGSTTHSQTLTGLAAGSSYNYYVRCKDASGNADSASTSISFNVSNTSSSTTSTLLFAEPFNNTSFTSRGWYDSTGGAVSTSSPYEGTGSFQCAFAAGGTNCSGGDPRRRLFTPTDSVYVSFWLKLGSNWQGSGQSYHPHMIYLMTDNDATDYEGMYGSVSTAYVEILGTLPQIGLQDGANINTSSIGTNLYGVTENRAAHGCNGWNDSNAWEVRDCFDAGGGTYVNGRMTRSSAGISLNTWHHFEAYFKMNSITGGVAQPDGAMKLWVDGTLVKNYADLILRTNRRATMKWNKIIISPYIGDGSPIAQSLYIDDLKVYDGIPTGSASPGSTTLSIQSITK